MELNVRYSDLEVKQKKAFELKASFSIKASVDEFNLSEKL